MREHKKYRIISLLLAVLLLCTRMVTPAMADETDTWKTVRVACDINKALYLNEEGKPEGYCSRYLIQLAEINHWKIEYVSDSWNASVQNLYDGKIDLLFPTQMTEERVGKKGFSSAIGGYQPIGLFVRSDSDICYEDYDAFNGKKVALSAGTSNEASMNAYAKQNGFTYESIYLDTVQDIFCDFFSAKLSFAYTAEEQEDIKSHGKVIVGVYEDTDPLFGVAQDGTYNGIYKDIIERIKALSGLEIEIKALNREEAAFEYYSSSKDCLNAVRSGKADMTLLNSWEYNYQSKNPKFEELIEWENSRTLSQSVFISLEGES